MNNATTKGFSLQTAPFSAVSNAKKVKLTDLTVTGYKDVDYWKETPFDCQVYITKIDEFGYTCDTDLYVSEDKLFQVGYVDFYDEGAWAGGYWYDMINSEEISVDNDREFDLGEGMFLSSPDPIESEVYTLVTAGQVANEDNVFPLRAGFNIIGNPMPVEVNVTDMSVAGYKDVPDWKETPFDCQVYITKIDEFGYTCDTDLYVSEDKLFQVGYVDFYDEGAWAGGYWYDMINSEDISPESGITFAAGEGLWVSAPESIQGETYTIEFPSPLVKHDAE